MHMPKYRAMAQDLRLKIEQGEYLPDQKLRTEEEYVQLYRVSRQTVRQALDMLVNEGLIYRRQGSGTFVGRPPAKRAGTKRIGVIATFINDYIFPALLRGIESALSQNGYAMELVATNNRVDTERRVLLDFLSKPIDGLLLEGTKTALPNPNMALYSQMQQKGLPMVFFNDYYENLPQIVSVTPDEEAGTRALMDYLLKKGCRKIGGLFKSDDIQGLQRYYGYMNACLEAGLPFSDEAVFWHNSENKRVFLEVVKTAPFLDVIRAQDGFLCYNDEIAIYLIQVLKQIGAPYPVIASFDNSILRQMSQVPFASLTHPKEQVGAVAAHKLINIIKGMEEQSVRLPWGELAL